MLRDEFAKAALKGLLAGIPASDKSWALEVRDRHISQLAKLSYDIADAMMKQWAAQNAK